MLRWHPRITPFRLAFVVSTTSLGIAKALLVSKGNSIGSTTVEWIAGVVLALSFQFLGNLESFDHHNAFTRFIFSRDCLAPLWSVISRPTYADDEHHRTLVQASDTADISIILVTPYRLLVSAVTVGFGAVKMACMYTGQYSAMNSTDWAFTVLTSFILYLIGLYENNTVSFACGFFKADCSLALTEVTIWASYITLTLSSILFCSIWSRFWFSKSFDYLTSQPPIIDGVPVPLAAPACIGGNLVSWMCSLHNHSYTVLVVSSWIVAAAFGIIPLFFVSLFFWDSTNRAGRSISSGTRRMSKCRLPSPPVIQELRSRAANAFFFILPFISTLALLVLQLAIIIVCLSSGILFFGMIFRNPMIPDTTPISSHTNSASVTPISASGVFEALCFAAASVLPLWAASQIAKGMLQPLVRILL